MNLSFLKQLLSFLFRGLKSSTFLSNFTTNLISHSLAVDVSAEVAVLQRRTGPPPRPKTISSLRTSKRAGCVGISLKEVGLQLSAEIRRTEFQKRILKLEFLHPRHVDPNAFRYDRSECVYFTPRPLLFMDVSVCEINALILLGNS